MLHVIESFGGGSAEAMRRYVTSTPDLDHHLLRALRPGEHADEDLSALFSTISELPRRLPPALLAVRRAISSLSPDVVHAHSTYGGAFVRLAVRRSSRRRIVYTPHCFAFERLDVSRTTRSMYRSIERMLAHNTTVVAACSNREAQLAGRLRAERRPVLVPNVAFEVFTASRAADATPVIAGMGRLGAQKDPAVFARVARRMGSSPEARSIDFLWIGDGDAEVRSDLEDAGVHVTGWVNSADAVRMLSSATAYLHTAAWEGYPLALLEAIASDLPVVVRRIPAFSDAPRAWTFESDAEAGSMIERVLTQSGAEANRADWRAATALNTPENQRRALLAAYGVTS